MNWIYSSAVQAGFGPPQWIVTATIFALLFVAVLETRGSASESDDHGEVLSRKEKRGLAVVSAILLPLIGFILWRRLVG
ncbi:MAG TPA: hypothetical protein VGM64_17725 [Lacunisphaera sp.]|jgi:hypothetical protein